MNITELQEIADRAIAALPVNFCATHGYYTGESCNTESHAS